MQFFLSNITHVYIIGVIAKETITDSQTSKTAKLNN